MRVSVTVHVKSKHPKVVVDDAGVFHVYVQALPIEGKANGEVVALLATHFMVAKSTIRLVRGARSKIKLFEIG